jgi:heptaprenyl diphosphate synthase
VITQLIAVPVDRRGPAVLEDVVEMVRRSLLCELSIPHSETLHELCSYIAVAPGKLVRPRLFCLCALLGNAPVETVVRAATALELTHCASIVHDDIIDQSQKRRGLVAAHKRFGDRKAVLLGDFLWAKALEVMMDAAPALSPKLVSLFNTLLLGEAHEYDLRHRLNLTEAQYMQVITEKTASFTAACCGMGARLGGTPDSLAVSLERYGLELGLSFQMEDDLLDITGDPKATGKPTGWDITLGIVTLPIIYGIEGGLSPEMIRMVMRPGSDLTELRQTLLSVGAIARARQQVAAHVQQAV